MFERHLIMDSDNEKSLYLFINFDYEFSRELGTKGTKDKAMSLYDKVIDYIKKNGINFKVGKVFLVVGGIVIGALFIQNNQFSDLKNELEPKYKYVEQIDIFNDDTLKKNIQIQKEEVIDVIIEKPTQINTNQTNKATIDVAEKKQAVTTNQSSQVATEAKQSTSTQETTTSPSSVEKIVTLYRSNGTVEQIDLENYVIGVVGAEMPASFHQEALKAQSVVARTYALKKLSKHQALSDMSSDQVYKDINQLRSLWGSSFDTYYEKIKNAAQATEKQFLTYNGDYIEAVYHSTSNGKTEDAVAVWGNSFPYLVSVDSHWDLEASSFLRETEKENTLLNSILGISFNETNNVKVLSRTNSNRIDKIEINGNIYTGIELRKLLGLRSTDFDINIEDNHTVFITKGYGHGVGMSQYGANGMAKEGYNYEQILAHYYPNTQLKR